MSTMIFVRSIATQNTQASPDNVAVDSGGNVYLSSNNSFAVVKLDSAGESKGVVGAVPLPTNPNVKLPPYIEAQALVTDYADNLYIAGSPTSSQQNHYQIYKYDSAGDLVGTWNQSNSALGLAVDTADNIYILSQGQVRSIVLQAVPVQRGP